MRRLATVAAAVVVGLAGGVPARSVTIGRGFTVEAAAFPVEPAPGLNQTALGVRPASTRVSLGNPPATAYGRAAAYDAGTIELYTGPPPPDTVAECDTGSPNIPDQATAAPAEMQLAARCDDRPAGESTAVARSYAASGMQVNEMASRAAGDGSGDAITAEATVTVKGIAVGPLTFESVSTRASVRADAKAGGAVATGRTVASGGAVNGTPVIVGPDGVDVDRQRVPLELVPSATEAVRAGLAQGGYSDVRVLQPSTEASPDGMHAAARGGGLGLYFTNNNPSENYFIRLTFAGVQLSVDVGPPVGEGGPLPAAGGGAVLPPGDAGDVLGSGRGPGGVEAGAPAAAPAGNAADGARPVLTAGRRTYDLPDPWRGWPVLIVVAGAAAVAGRLTRRRLLGWWDANADRYLRG